MGESLYLQSNRDYEFSLPDPMPISLSGGGDCDGQLDRFCLLATQTIRSPAALITIGSDHRQWIKACCGMMAPDPARLDEPLPTSIFSHIAESAEPIALDLAEWGADYLEMLQVEEGAAASLLATALRDRDGNLLGTVSVLNNRPRQWNAWRREALTSIAAIIENHIDTDTKVASIRAAQWRSDLVAREMSHRMRNVFTVVSGFVSISARKHPESAALASMILGRIEAFATATDYVVPKEHAGSKSTDKAELDGLIRNLCRAYDTNGRIEIHGGRLPMMEKAALVISLVIHELGTNSLKYGSLSAPGGKVSVDCHEAGDRFRIIWREHDGPTIASPPTRVGFGSRMCKQAVGGSLHGSVTYDWKPEGLTVIIEAERGLLIK